MPKNYVVKPGDCLSQIAWRHGFADYRAIYEHPSNAEFRRRRPNPNLIHPGDRLVIPDLQQKKEACEAGAVHRFVIRHPKRKLKLRLVGAAGAVLRDTPYTLEAGTQTLEGRTSGDGTLEVQLPMSVSTATLKASGRLWTLRIGHLNPVSEVGGDLSGVQARLSNLGYATEKDGRLGEKTRAAIRAFQAAQNLPVNGECTEALVSRLKEVYGC